MTANSQLLTTTPKTKNKSKLSKQLDRNRTTEMEITWRLSTGEWERERGGKGTENKQHKWQVENRQGGG